MFSLEFFSYFDPLFCEQDNLKMTQSNALKFGTHNCIGMRKEHNKIFKLDLD